MIYDFWHAPIFFGQNASKILNAMTTYMAESAIKTIRKPNLSKKSAPSLKLLLTRIIIATIAEGIYFAIGLPEFIAAPIPRLVKNTSATRK